jgi:transposase-like protein
MSSRRKYTQEYKREAVQLAQAGEAPLSQVARELGVTVANYNSAAVGNQVIDL